MPLDGFEILLDKPSSSFQTGQFVTGKVYTWTNTEKQTTGLQIILKGKAEAEWRSGGPHGLSYSNKDVFFHHGIYLMGNGQSKITISPGQSFYPFSILLPSNLPGTFVGSHGSVKYTLKAVFERSWKYNLETKVQIPVRAVVNLNAIPEANQFGEWTNSKYFGYLCCSSQPLTLNVRLEKKGCCAKAFLRFEVEVDNLSGKVISDLTATLVQVVSYYASGNTKHCKNKIVQTRFKSIAAGKADTWNAHLRVPDVPPTMLYQNEVIDVEYILNVKAYVSGIALNMKCECPIIVGTVPLQPSAFH